VRHSLGLLLLAVFGFAPNMSAQSLERGKQLFNDAKYAAAKAELTAVQKAEDQPEESVGTAGNRRTREIEMRKGQVAAMTT
jgi:hypothetical protein